MTGQRIGMWETMVRGNDWGLKALRESIKSARVTRSSSLQMYPTQENQRTRAATGRFFQFASICAYFEGRSIGSKELPGDEEEDRRAKREDGVQVPHMESEAGLTRGRHTDIKRLSFA